MSNNVYPAPLVPQAKYVKWQPEEVPGGILQRWVNKPTRLNLEKDGKINISLFRLPGREGFANHLSVNLLGVFRPEDAAWQPLGQHLTREWMPGTDGILPSETEATCRPHPWGYWWMPIEALHKSILVFEGATYSCCVRHEPSQCNFWHFEVRFFGPDGKDTRGMDDKTKRRFTSLLTMRLVEEARPEVLPFPQRWEQAPMN